MMKSIHPTINDHKCHEKKFFHIDGSTPTTSEDRMSDEALESEEKQPTSSSLIQ
jgi:hypothetical protein